MSSVDGITPVALVPYPEDLVPSRELLHVAAAIQTQLMRDLSPLWGVAGLVSPFGALGHLPPGYIPLVIVEALSANEHGFHFAAGGQPIALIVYSDGWSVRASHELIETLCDPWGKRTTPGPSLDKDNPGQVDYLVEVCDPCQFGTYEIGNVPVSDFVTPDYYRPVKLEGARYSYKGTIKEPRQLLDGGYITWLTRPPADQIFQAFAPPGQRGDPEPAQDKSVRIEAYEDVAPAFSRAWVDAHPTKGLRGVSDGAADGESRAKGPFYGPDDSAKHYGRAMENEVTRILGIVESSGSGAPSPTIHDVIDVLRRLAAKDDQGFREEFASDPGRALAKLNIQKPIGLPTPLKPLPAREEYEAVLAKLEHGGFGPYFGDPDIGNLLATLGTLGTLGISG